MTERLHFPFSLPCIGEGNGNPLQCSCLENPRDGGAWWAAIYGVTQSWTWLERLSSSSSSIPNIDWALVILKWCFAIYLKFRFDWAGWDGAALQACAFKANPSSSDTQRGAESSRGLMLVSGVWAGNWGLEVYKTLSSLRKVTVTYPASAFPPWRDSGSYKVPKGI